MELTLRPGRHEIIEKQDLVHEWRVARLARLGIPWPVAEAAAGQVDWHQMAALVQRGCPPWLALRIPPATAAGRRAAGGPPRTGITGRPNHREDIGGRPVGYSTAPWAGFGEALAAVAGALTGLLFVALSVKSDALAASGSLRARATQTLVLFMTAVLVAVSLVAPQPAAALGAELLAVAVVSGTGLLILDRRAGHGSDQEVARYIERFSPNTITAVLVGVAGLTLLVKGGGGLYWLIPAAMASLAGGVFNAWLFLVRLTGES